MVSEFPIHFTRPCIKRMRSGQKMHAYKSVSKKGSFILIQDRSVFALHLISQIFPLHWEVWCGKEMATNITCYAKPNFLGYSKNYNTDQPDITEAFPSGVGSAIVSDGVVTVYQLTNYHGESADLRIPPGKYPDNSKFPPGGFKSLKVNWIGICSWLTECELQD